MDLFVVLHLNWIQLQIYSIECGKFFLKEVEKFNFLLNATAMQNISWLSNPLCPSSASLQVSKTLETWGYEIAVLVPFLVEKQGEPELGGRQKGSPDTQLFMCAVLAQQQQPSAITASLLNG